ncbi:MAG: tetratricopeptide repeat protein [Pseudomonadota bacterium]
MLRPVFLLPATLALLCLTVATTVWSSNDPAYVGTATCAGCHADEHAAWQGSHHDMSMRHATAESVIGDFNNAEITVHGVTSRFYQRDGKYFVTTDGPDGRLQEFEIGYTFGIEPLQQYLIAFPDGRLQALGLSWDARPEAEGGQRWYHLYPDEPLKAGDLLHWTGPQQNWNYMCADCHSTNLVKGYDAQADRFDTTWAEVNVGCEACHGPGQKHVAWAGSDDAQQATLPDKGLALLFHDRKGVAWPINPDTGLASRLGGEITRTEIESCAACHSRRGLLAEGRERDPTFLDHHMPAFLTDGLYFPDGQIHDEVFVWGSYTQSKMHEVGVTCSDCHDPHSQKLKASGDNVCAQCHLPTKFAVTEHHGHPADSPGADCLGCHMPERTYMGVDDRRDHSMRIPRPDWSLEYGTPNACTQCHEDKDDAWAAQAFSTMFPDVGAPFQHWVTAFHQAREGLPQAEVSLLSVYGKEGTPDLARATAILELRAYLSPLSGQVVEQALRDESPLVRIAALRVIESIPPASRFPLAGHLLNDPVLAVRSEAARMLAGSPRHQLDVAARGALERAIRDYFNVQQLNADRPESGFNLGNLSLDAGNATQAERYYRQSIARDDTFTPSWLNLSELYRGEGMVRESKGLLEEGLGKNPEAADLHHALGLAYVREGSNDQALASLKSASDLAPDAVRYGYVYGVALNSTGQPEAAVTTLESVHQRHPNSRDVLFALATIERDRGNRDAAIGWARGLLSLNPADQQADQLLRQLEGGS